MELAGGVVVLLVVALLMLTICAGGLCAEGQATRSKQKEVRK